jgi:hypothetical protein
MTEYFIVLEDLKDNSFKIIDKVDDFFKSCQKLMDHAFDFLKTKDGDNYCKKIYSIDEKNRPWSHFIEANLKNTRNLFTSINIKNKIKIKGILYDDALFIDVVRLFIIEK